MEVISKRKNMKYSFEVNKILFQKRNKLIQLVFEENVSIKDAGDSLGFKNSTAKMIIRKYKNHGKVTKFKEEEILKEIEPIILVDTVLGKKE